MVEEVPTTEEGPRMVRVPPEPEVEEWSGCDTIARNGQATPPEWEGLAQQVHERERKDWSLRVVVRWLGGKRKRRRKRRSPR